MTTRIAERNVRLDKAILKAAPGSTEWDQHAVISMTLVVSDMHEHGLDVM